MKHVKVQNGNLYRYLLDPFGKIVAGILSCDSLKCGVGVSHPKIDPTSFNMIHFISLRFLTWWCATEHLSGMVSCSTHPLSQLTNHPVREKVSTIFSILSKAVRVTGLNVWIFSN